MADPQLPDIGAPGAPGRPVPPDSQPGHHPAQEEDKPDLGAFAARLGVVEPEADGRDGGGPAGRSRLVALVALAVAAATLLTLLGVIVGRKRRSRR